MKYIFPSVLAVGLLASACSNSGDKPAGSDSLKKDSVAAVQYFGDTITADGAIPASQVLEKLGHNDSLMMKVEGKVVEVCQKKGCWMQIDLGNEKTMRVTFKDYAFFVPKDASGKTMIIEGYAYNDTTSVAELREYAKDAGESKEAIEKITEPEVEISFEAHGVMLKND
ncbi:MAG: DUF4920 domain-containing protein [Bacteroidia bacterium]